MHGPNLREVLGQVVAAFDVDVRPDRSDQLRWCVLVEQDRVIDDVQRADERQPVRFSVDGTGRSFESPRAGVGVETDDENVSQSAGPAQKLHVSGMKDVEHAVGEDDALAQKSLGFDPSDHVFER